MEMEYKDPSRRGRYIVIIGVILAVVAGAAAFYLISTAQQQAGQAGLQRVSVVVALQTIPARKVIEATDLEVREVPLDPTNALGIVSTPDKVIGRVPAVAILTGQMVTTNLLASSAEGGQFSVLGPEEMKMMDGMYGKDDPSTFTRGAFGSDFGMFGFYVQHNITIGLNTGRSIT